MDTTHRDTCKGKRILVVEVDLDLRELIVEELSALGAKVDESSNARDGFNLALSHPPDLVISEVDTPYQSGMDLLRGIKTNFPLVPVILMSGSRRITESQAYFAGAQAIFHKPFEVRSLVRTVRRFLSPEREVSSRRHPRYDVNLPAEVMASENSVHICRVMNLSKVGAFVECGADLPNLPEPGKVISFRIRAGQFQELVIEGSAVVRWVREKSEFGDRPVGCGVEFADVEGEFEQKIIEALKTVRTG